MPTQRKVETVADLTDRFQRAQCTIVADYRGLTVAEISDLRKRLRETGAELMVAKNTLVLLAARETGSSNLEPLLAGPTALAFAFDDFTKTAKAITDFNKGPKKLAIRGGSIGGALLGEDALDQLIKLPTREQSIAKVLGGVQAPASQILGIMNTVMRNIAYILKAHAEQEGAAAA